MNKADLQKTAYLARIQLSKEEEAEWTEQLKVVFKYFNQIASKHTESTRPLVYPLEGIEPSSPLRADKAQMPQNQEELLGVAPDRLGQEYKVPPVVE